jgi:GT2 family glycosyltransferase
VVRLAIICPVFGQTHLTAGLMSDVERDRDLLDVLIVDNGGDYVPQGREHVLRPGRNLRWLRGSNLGLRAAQASGRYDAYVLLNNDTRLSPGFFRELVAAWRSLPRAGVLAPLYDDCYPQQRSAYVGPAGRYQPIRAHRTANFVDGTCMLLPDASLRRLGFLDEQTFGGSGWGADVDYCLRARRAGLRVYVTERAYLNHLREQTVKAVTDDYAGYKDQAHREMETNMAAKWGPAWRAVVGAPERFERQADLSVRALATLHTAARRLGVRRWDRQVTAFLRGR